MCSINLCCRWSLFVAALLFSASVFVGCGDDGGGGPTGQPDAFTDTSSNDTGGSTEPPLDWYWQIGVSRASIPTTKPNGDSWDAFGGAPDPFVCLEIGTNQPICTVTLQDTFTPRWDSLSTASFTYAQLQDVNFALADEDVSEHDVILGDNISIELPDMQAREYRLFGENSDVEVWLTLVPR